MNKEHKFEIWQDGFRVASGSGRDMEALNREAWHYAMVYGQDGPVEIRWKSVPQIRPTPAKKQEKKAERIKR